MARPLLNYTSEIPVSRTVGEIQALLSEAGARSLSIEYDHRVPCALSFTIATGRGDLAYRVPVTLPAILAILERLSNEYGLADRYGQRRRKLPQSWVTPEHAARVGWRVLKDWLEAQVALIEIGLVELPQIFLPYQLVDGQKTVYELAVERGLLALPKPGADAAR
jgi:hypothetical protein